MVLRRDAGADVGIGLLAPAQHVGQHRRGDQQERRQHQERDRHADRMQRVAQAPVERRRLGRGERRGGPPARSVVDEPTSRSRTHARQLARRHRSAVVQVREQRRVQRLLLAHLAHGAADPVDVVRRRGAARAASSRRAGRRSARSPGSRRRSGAGPAPARATRSAESSSAGPSMSPRNTSDGGQGSGAMP